MNHQFLGLVCTAAIVSLAGSATAAPIFSQTLPNITGYRPSDRDFSSDGRQVANPVTLSSLDTVRSVTWKGIFAPGGNPPSSSTSFELIFYHDTGAGLPDATSVISSTTVSINGLINFADTGADSSGYDVYEFQANVTPTVLPAANQVWFSVLADTTDNPNEFFYWNFVGLVQSPTAVRQNLSTITFEQPEISLPSYFVLDNAFIPEPNSLALLSLGGLVIARRRRA